MARNDLARLQVVLEAETSKLHRELEKVNNRFAKWETRTKRSVDGVKASIATIGTAIAAIASVRGLVNIAVEFERLNTTLTSLTGSAKGAETAMNVIRDFAASTPFQVQQLTDTFIKLQSFGITPTIDVMRAITDQASLLGGSQEQLTGITLALGQAWSKQKLQGEEILQLVERGVPVWDLLSKALGKTTLELQDMSQKGQLGRDAISGLMREMGKASFGAAAKQADTLGGAFSNLSDTIDRIVDKIMNKGGLSDALKRATVDFADMLATIAGTRTAAQVEREMEQIQKQIDQITKQSEYFDKKGIAVPSGMVQQVQYWQAKLKELSAELDTMRVKAKQDSEDLAGALGGGSTDTTAGLVSAGLAGIEEGSTKGAVSENPWEKKLEQLDIYLMDVETREVDSWWRRQEILDNALETQLLSEERHKELSEALESKHLENLYKLNSRHVSKEQKLWASGLKGKLKVTSSVLGMVSNLMQSENKKQFEIGKKAAIAQTVIDTHQMAVDSYKALAGIPIVGPALGAAAAIAAIAYGMSQVNAIKSQSFDGGGGVSAPSAVGTYSANPNTGLPTQQEGFGEEQAPRQEVNVFITGNPTGEQVRELIESINTEVGNGVELRATVVAG